MDKELSKQISGTIANLNTILGEIPYLSKKDMTTIASCIRVLQKHCREGIYVPKGHLTLPELSRLYKIRLGDMSAALNLLNMEEPKKYSRVKIPKLGHFSYVYSPETVKAVEKYVQDVKRPLPEATKKALEDRIDT